ncbi:MAG: hypothetical protein HY461_01395 [Parcubacteria group bacterium]|nr:hypothetical protein [Parcubacteria group bacterium]
MKKVAVFLASLIWAVSLVAIPAVVGAQTDIFGINYGASTGLPQQDPRETVANIIKIALSFLGIVAVVIVLWGGVLWMTAAGNDDKVAQAKKVLFSGLIGLIIILSAFAITRFVTDQLISATGTNS